MSLNEKLEGAKSKAQEIGRWRNFTKNQFRSIYGHLKSLEKIQDEKVFEIEIKLLLARLFYKTQRSQAKLDKLAYDFFEKELYKNGKVLPYNEFKHEFIKYMEAVLAYSYEYLKN